MLNIPGSPQRFCNGMTRRQALKVGTLGLGLSLADVLRARAAAPTPKPPRSIIMVSLDGGPSHIDLYDLKPDAPQDIRGEFKPIKTNVPGFELGELLPLQATIADKLALVRGLEFIQGNHELGEVYSGFEDRLHRPSFGAVISRFQKRRPEGLPGYVSLGGEGDRREFENARYLGVAHKPFNYSSEELRNLRPHWSVSQDRLKDRRSLVGAFDSLRRDLDAQQEFGALDAFQSQALEMITSAKARDAFDLSKEPDRVLEKYGGRSRKYGIFPWPTERFLLARRLVEAGVSVVSFQAGHWDHHGTTTMSPIFPSLRTIVPHLDRSIHALVTDLHERGLDQEVLVLVWGEFGRTPRINPGAGRDHHAPASFALFAGGGLRTGLVVGATDSQGQFVKERRVTPQNIFATVYQALGVDLDAQPIDFTGRPTSLLDDREPIRELLG
jgi:Protein of unknown function (DUF1501)